MSFDGVQRVRPSIADLSSEDFFENLHVESNKLRNDRSFTYTNPRPEALNDSTASNIGLSKPTRKKSQFAQQREAELKNAGPQSALNFLDNTVPVPTGRFELDLDEGNATDRDELYSQDPSGVKKAAIIGQIVERDQSTLSGPHDDFASGFQRTGFPTPGSWKPNPPQVSVSSPNASSKTPSLPPWELKRLANLKPSHATPPKTMAPTTTADALFSPEVKNQISSENDSLLANMSEAEILQEQAALKAQLMQSNPALLTKLLSKHNIELPSDHKHLAMSEQNLNCATSNGKKPKHVRYSEAVDVIDAQSRDSHVDPGSCPPPQNPMNGSCHTHGPDQLQPVRFNLNGKRTEDSGQGHPMPEHLPEYRTADIHTHQTNEFTLKQLFRIILSSVPSQRVIGFKVMAQITQRYFEKYSDDCEDAGAKRLVQELNGAILDMLMAASQAVRDKNVGVATSALMLLDSILSNAQSAQAQTRHSGYQSSFQSAWIEQLLTQTPILAEFHRHFQHQTLPTSSLVLIVRILQAMIVLGEPSKVSEEIVKIPTFLEAVIQVLVVIPWPPISSTKLLAPDLNALELLETMARASRACSRSILDRGLLTPTLRFIGLPYWKLTGYSDAVNESSTLALNDDTIEILVRLMCHQFQLIRIFAMYGLGTSLRTTLDPLLRSTTLGLRKVLENAVCQRSAVESSRMVQELKLVSAYLILLRGWMQCADDPHVSDPPHSINWTQVAGWESESLDFLELALGQSKDLCVKNDVLACACSLTEVYIGGSDRKSLDISACMTRLNALAPQLQFAFQRAAENFTGAHSADLSQQSNLLYACRLLISFAKLSTTISRVKLKPAVHPLLTLNALACHFSNDAFALACRLGFEVEELSALPWALSVLHRDLGDEETSLEKLLVSSLLVRNSDGMIASELIATTLQKCQAKANSECQRVISNSEQTSAPDLCRLFPVYQDYINHSATLTSISHPSPKQIQNQISQSDRPAFLLTSTWPLLAISFLNQEHVKSTSGDDRLTSMEVMRGSYALSSVLQAVLSQAPSRFPSLLDIFQQLVSDRYTVWNSVMMTVIATNSQATWSSSKGTEACLGSIFEDDVTCQLITRLLGLCHLRSSRAQPSKHSPGPFEACKIQPTEESELYTMFTNILGAYDSTSFGNRTFSTLLVPFFGMSHPRDFRELLFSDYGHILRHLKVSVEDVLVLDDSARGLGGYMYPVEETEQLLYTYSQLLTTKSAIGLSEHPFLSLYLLHHIASQIWNPGAEERLRVRLVELILSGASEEVCRCVLAYNQSWAAALGEAEPKLPPICFELDEDAGSRDQRRRWLHEVITDEKRIERLNQLGWGIPRN